MKSLRDVLKEQLNEGGGAGIKYKLNGTVGFEFDISITKKGVKIKKAKVIEFPDTFDAEGYNDGLRDVRTDNILYIDDKDLKSIDLSDIMVSEYGGSYYQELADMWAIEYDELEELSFNVDKVTFEELFKKYPKEKFSGTYTLYVSEPEEMTGRGWTRPSGYSKGEGVMSFSLYDYYDEDELVIDNYELGGSGDGIWFDAPTDTLTVLAGSEFDNFYQDIFNNYDAERDEFWYDDMKDLYTESKVIKERNKSKGRLNEGYTLKKLYKMAKEAGVDSLSKLDTKNDEFTFKNHNDELVRVYMTSYGPMLYNDEGDFGVELNDVDFDDYIYESKVHEESYGAKMAKKTVKSLKLDKSSFKETGYGYKAKDVDTALKIKLALEDEGFGVILRDSEVFFTENTNEKSKSSK